MSRGLLVVVSSPSGGGKDTVINELLSIFPDSVRLLTTTSRLPRPGDVDGVDYNFVSKDEFEDKIKNNELVEYNNYVGNYYGIEKKELEKSLEKNGIVFTNIEVNGKESLDKLGIKHLAIFLLPGSLEVLHDRIANRGGVTKEIIARRLDTAKQEMKKSNEYDYRVANKDGKFDETVKELTEIIQKELEDRN